jgi:hypothetical protein
VIAGGQTTLKNFQGQQMEAAAGTIVEEYVLAGIAAQDHVEQSPGMVDAWLRAMGGIHPWIPILQA